jgi:prepilin-type N-terminal cleavage/methylation domain-containing protein
MSGKPFAIATARRTCDAFTLKQRGRSRGFTLAELLVSVFVLSIIILMVAQLMSSATAITRTGHTHISTDTQARTVFDRMAVDFAQMLKRTDIDYYVKGPSAIYNGHGNGHGWGNRKQTGQQGSDQIAFFSHVPGYYPSSGAQSPISLVAYRINEGANTNPAFLRLQRMGKGLLWNGVDNPNKQPTQSQFTSPMVFLPLTIGGASGRWPDAVSGSTVNDDYETIGPGVFRFEYYYLIKNGRLDDVPWDKFARPAQTTLSNPQSIGLADIEAIVVAIAVIDSAGRALIDPNSLDDLASDMDDFRSAHGRGNGGTRNIGDLEYSWTAVLVGDPTQALPGVINTGLTSNGTPVPPEAAKAIRIYSKTFDLRSL